MFYLVHGYTQTKPEKQVTVEQLEAQQQLTLRSAIALVRDRYTAESQLYLELQETVRAQPGLPILAALDGSPPATSVELTTIVNDIEPQYQLKIAEDETLISSFWVPLAP